VKIKQIKETCIYTSDISAARKFYHELLGLPVIGEAAGKHVFFRAGTSVLLCFNPDDSRLKTSPPPHFANGKYHFAFEVSAIDYEFQKRKMLELGISIIDTVLWKNGQESFYFNDPIGNVVEIVPEGIWD
jgi:catechol 2,3-dioxygenase-like lactoylglutathione lyase family enzyme